MPRRVIHIPPTMPPLQRLAIINALADEGAREPAIRLLAARFWRQSRGNQRAYAAIILRYAQRIPFVPDPPGEEVYKDAVSALRGDDCDGKLIVLLALARARGIKGRPIWLEQRGPLNHVTGQLLLGGRLLWADPSVEGARLGEYVYDALERLGGEHPAFRSTYRPTYRPAGAASSGAGWSCDPSAGLQPGMPPWQSCVDVNSSLVHTMLPEWADGWIDAAVAASTPQKAQALDSAGWEAQHRANRDLWRMLSNAWRALNFPPLSSPVFRTVMDTAFGANARYSGNTRDQALKQEFHPQTVWVSPGSSFYNSLRGAWSQLGKDLGEFDGHLRAVYLRGMLDGEGLPVFNCDGNPFDPTSEGGCDWRPGAFAYRGCAYAFRPTEGCDPYNWNVVNWHDPPQGTAAVKPPWEFLPPLRWFFELGGQLARAMKDFGGARAIVADGMAWAIILNAKEALRLGLTEGAPELHAAVLQLPASIEYLNIGMTDARKTAIAVLGAAAGIAAAIPVYGWIAAAALGLAAFIAKIFPNAVGIITDRYGRALMSAKPNQDTAADGSVFEVDRIDPHQDASHPPTYDVPEPPENFMEQPAPPPSGTTSPQPTSGRRTSTPPNLSQRDLDILGRYNPVYRKAAEQAAASQAAKAAHASTLATIAQRAGTDLLPPMTDADVALLASLEGDAFMAAFRDIQSRACTVPAGQDSASWLASRPYCPPPRGTGKGGVVTITKTTETPSGSSWVLPAIGVAAVVTVVAVVALSPKPKRGKKRNAA